MERGRLGRRPLSLPLAPADQPDVEQLNPETQGDALPRGESFKAVVLHALRRGLGTESPYHVISCYRSPKTNAKLRAAGRAVAENSLHMRGKAMDVRLPGVPLGDLHRAAVALKAGGVGYYSGPSFVHVDVGRVRYW